MNKNLMIKGVTFGLILAFQGMGSDSIEACSRVQYTGNDGLVISGRTMDWLEDLESNLYIFPRGMERSGGLTSNSVKWVSKYGSMITAGYDLGTADGMNEKGLVTNILFLKESNYTRPNDTRPVLGISMWAQYVLDNFSTVKEAVAVLSKDAFQINAPELPNGIGAYLHLALSDPSGNNAIIEYKDGNIMIYEGPQYKVMTNSPFYFDQLAINEYWTQVGGLNMLPGTNRATDRFARASFYIDVIPKTADQQIGVAGVFSVLRNVSVPLGIKTADQPNIASTIWRTVCDQKNMKYYYESTLSPNVFWVDFKDVDFSPAGGVRKLPLTDGEIYAGNAASKFVKAPAFEFLLGK
ncbi:MAG: linear amide C-N hydrolase [Bacteroidales bacterium]